MGAASRPRTRLDSTASLVDVPERRDRARGTTPTCLVALGAGLLALLLVVVTTGIVMARVDDWLDFNPFGLFADLETTIDDRQAAIVLQMQAPARLETMTYTVEKVISAEKEGNVFQDLLFGDRILLIAQGEVIASVDLSTLQEDDVQVAADDSVTVRLPPAAVFVAALNNDETRVYDREQGLLARGDAQMETRARQAAEDAILQAACEQGIQQRAADEARTQVEALLRLLEFERVTVIAEPGS
jgi:hypothetical protein